MSADSIQIQGVQPEYRPGETISGAVSWSTEQRPSRIEIRLFWFTLGHSPHQLGLVEKRVVAAPNPFDSTRFEFRLPEGPWSFGGFLTGINWAVEAVMVPSRHHARVTFVLGPEGRPVFANAAQCSAGTQ
jgi:hypothetical protein